MNTLFNRTALTIGLLAGATAHGAAINVTNLLQNASFEANLNGCPTNWVCSQNTANPFVVTANEFGVSPGNGLPGVGLRTPDGNNAVVMPPQAGASIMAQQFGTFTAGDSYVLTFWTGSPLHVPELNPPVLAAPVAAPPGLIQVFFAAAGGNVAVSTPFSITPSAYGQWALWQVELSAAAAAPFAGQNAWVGFRVEAGANESIATFDMVPSTPFTVEPEPASIALFGIGLVGLGLASRFRKKT